jgi:hypothetical protein
MPPSLPQKEDAMCGRDANWSPQPGRQRKKYTEHTHGWNNVGIAMGKSTARHGRKDEKRNNINICQIVANQESNEKKQRGTIYGK